MESTSLEVDDRFIDITPLPHILLSMGAQNLAWWKAIGELVDNSFDAKATRVQITSAARTVSVSDDGRGMPDIAVAITMGGHKGQSEHLLGRYGVGLKDAWRSAGERIEVVTVRNGVRSHLDFSVNAIEVHDRNWKLPRPVTSQTGEKSGTKIILHLREGKNRPGSDAWEMLAWVFTPALLTGRQIVHGTGKTVQPLSPCKFPALSESVCDAFEVCGKQVKIEIGIMAPGERIYKAPFWVQYGHRNIVHSSIGVGEYDDEHLAGTITLGDGWKLTKNKDDFDDHKDELADAIHQRIKPLLLKAAAISQDIESSALTTQIAGYLNSALEAQKREKRNSTRETQGTVASTNSGKRRKKAKEIHDHLPGSVVGPNQTARRGFTLSWIHDPTKGIGEYDHYANRIKLNWAHPFVGKMKAEKNDMALYAVASAILTDDHCNRDGNTKLLCPNKDFTPVFSFVTERIGGVE